MLPITWCQGTFKTRTRITKKGRSTSTDGFLHRCEIIPALRLKRKNYWQYPDFYILSSNISHRKGWEKLCVRGTVHVKISMPTQAATFSFKIVTSYLLCFLALSLSTSMQGGQKLSQPQPSLPTDYIFGNSTFTVAWGHVPFNILWYQLPDSFKTMLILFFMVLKHWRVWWECFSS